MSEFWLISAPGDKENLQALERMNTVTSKSNLSYNTKFSIPDFKVGTLDSLVGLSDELGKLDTFAESLIKRMAQSVVEVMEDSKGKVPENLLANGGLKEKLKCLKIDLTSFVTHFEWDMAKYPAKQPLVSVVDTLAKQLAQIETDLKSRTAAYNTLKTNLENLEKKSMGNLFTRTLSDIVSKEDFVLDSEYLVTLLVIVPKPSYTQWQKTYESLSDMVVPRSTKLIAEDNEGGLFTVTLFRKVIDDFKTKAKENKFTVREFYYDEKEIKREREELSRLLSDKKQQYGPLLRWLKVNFSEAFIAWIHIKALRVFVESVLRSESRKTEAEHICWGTQTVRTSSEFPGGAPPASQEVLHQTFKRGSELCLQTSGSSSGCKRVGCVCGHPGTAARQPRLLSLRLFPHRPQPARLGAAGPTRPSRPCGLRRRRGTPWNLEFERNCSQKLVTVVFIFF
ncbi:V-type proton ATPase subunit C 2 isoform X17 [Leopardus geoffroyi]|uniref:V-type proton ATPase subunit C 2 isoform X17 n=1 Tax=Leopardus geoffroyi TaxID=46844 RepID=UPI001E25F91E|nr:V-type proton ATPase subunit C 2 isoform X17 [Leopardus geoffroyi]